MMYYIHNILSPAASPWMSLGLSHGAISFDAYDGVVSKDLTG